MKEKASLTFPAGNFMDSCHMKGSIFPIERKSVSRHIHFILEKVLF